MNGEQITLLAILIATLGLFLWGRFRHDLVALMALIACVLVGVVPAEHAFLGLGHPAVITVASVLVLSSGLQATGAVDALALRLLPTTAGITATIAALMGLGAVLSAFMNNVGAMALLMPIALQVAARFELPPGKVLMPLAFGTILGGMTTLIGTPPNLIVSAFREESGAGGFAMFDFTPVGLTVAGIGVTFAALLGWRIVPGRDQKGAASFDTGKYFTEARVREKGPADGRCIREVQQQLEASDAQIVGMARGALQVSAPNPGRRLRSGDVLVIEAEPESLARVLSRLGLDIGVAPSVEGKAVAPAGAEDRSPETPSGEDAILQELVALPTSRMNGRTAHGVQLSDRFSVNLLAISRQGLRTVKRLRSTRVHAGDVLLLRGSPEAVSGFASEYGLLPLAHRPIRIPDKRRAVMATAVMIAAIAASAFGLLPAAVAFAAGVLLFLLLRVVPLRGVYEIIDWPVVVLLGALIPVAGAAASTGTADVLARVLLENLAQGRPLLALTLILVATMTLSDFMNNAATAAVMGPIALSAAAQMNVQPDAFLMAVAVGASCAFLTPIGHQNNTLILGPGGFRFGDYWRLGLPMEVLVVGVSVPMLVLVWPL